jgi:hypothetical protein
LALALAACGLAPRPSLAGQWQVTFTSTGTASVTISKTASATANVVVNGVTCQQSQSINLAGQDHLCIDTNTLTMAGPNESGSASVSASLSVTYRVQWLPDGGSLTADPAPAFVNLLMVHN